MPERTSKNVQCGQNVLCLFIEFPFIYKNSNECTVESFGTKMKYWRPSAYAETERTSGFVCACEGLILLETKCKELSTKSAVLNATREQHNHFRFHCKSFSYLYSTFLSI